MMNWTNSKIVEQKKKKEKSEIKKKSVIIEKENWRKTKNYNQTYKLQSKPVQIFPVSGQLNKNVCFSPTRTELETI